MSGYKDVGQDYLLKMYDSRFNRKLYLYDRKRTVTLLLDTNSDLELGVLST